jgi:hypothetical protein
MLRALTSVEALLAETLPLELTVDTETATVVMVAHDLSFGHLIDVAYNPACQEN